MDERPKLIIHSASQSSNVWTLKENLDYARTIEMDGMVMNGASSWNLMKPGVEISLEDTRSQMAGLETFNAERHNYFLTQTDDPGDVFDDAAWAQVVENFRVVAQAAQEAGFKGLIFDNEEYFGQWQNFPEHYENADPSNEAAYQAQAALRGRQIMEAIAEVFPDAEFGVMHGPYASVFAEGQPDAIQGQAGGPDRHELRGPFFTGLAEGLGPDQTLIDMGELYALRSEAEFLQSQTYRSDVLPDLFDWDVPQALRDGWDDAIVQSHMLITTEFPEGAVMSPEILQTTLLNAFKQSEERVFVFSNPGEEDWFTPGALDPAWRDAIVGATAAADQFFEAEGTPQDETTALGDGLQVIGTQGVDDLTASDAADLIRGLGENDRIASGDGADRVFGGTGNDTIFGGAGDDTLYGGAHGDFLHGGGGADTLFGNAGDDNVWGLWDDDVISGGAGDDWLRGGDGDDRLSGGAGEDRLWGDGGADVFSFEAGDGLNVIADFDSGSDQIMIAGQGFDMLDINQRRADAVILFADVEVVLTGIDAASLDASDFLF